ncbi:MAG: 1-deoxy-D-xylulose-5-phosphate reductoisomerase [Sedimentisphaerales bacterium]|nr:1-deoxy-D-xylulose-5-phosphate reductoisomerase [Sedimentisphaerales bacterium]
MSNGTKNIAILGSTGSVGRNALKVIAALGKGFRAAALSAHSNYKLLAEQAKQYQPDVICISDESNYEALRVELKDFGGKILCGGAGLVEIAESGGIDIVLTSIVGVAGLAPVLAAAKSGKRLAIANKEPLVVAGRLLTETAKANGAEILPVDSEHSAIFQCMQAGCVDEVQRIILTASGGPFRGYSAQQIRDVTLEQALAHPTWNMGPKITVDSATMMNKSLEVIEARWLFGLPIEKIEVLIHPESIVHSLVEYVDGSVIAQMGTPDMCLPIQYALTYPQRVKGIANHLKLDELGSLNFEKPDVETFRALKLAFEVAETGGTACAVFNAANEAAVGLFLDGKINFVNIVEAIEHCLEKHEVIRDASLEELLDTDLWAREEVNQCLNPNTVKK